jgi:signal transduction histidine kinase
VFTNYLSNAIHYVKEGGEIRISVEHIPGDQGTSVTAELVPDPPVRTAVGDRVRVSVFNEGPTLSEEALEKVFVKFYKEDAARTRSYGGSGIGLSIVEAIQKAHGQDYGVYNEENGVVFYYDMDGSGSV